jgi:adenylate cyclase
LYGYIGEFEKAGQMAEKIQSLAERLDDPDMQFEGHLRLGYTIAITGDVHVGLDHLEQAIAGYDPERYGTPRFHLGVNSGVISLNVSALFLWMAGSPERALERAYAGVALARRLNHPYSLSYALFHTGVLHLWRREVDLTQQYSQAVLVMAKEHEFLVWEAVATCLNGAALSGMGQVENGLAQIHHGIDLYQGLNTPPVFWPLLIFMQAEAYGLAGKPEQGLAVLDRALGIFDPGGYDVLLADAYRLKGDLQLALSSDHAHEAETSYQRAREIAQKQRVPMLELRAAIRLSRLWRDQGKAEQGRQLLSAVYESFTEGFNTADLMEAKDLLSRN